MQELVQLMSLDNPFEVSASTVARRLILQLRFLTLEILSRFDTDSRETYRLHSHDFHLLFPPARMSSAL